MNEKTPGSKNSIDDFVNTTILECLKDGNDNNWQEFYSLCIPILKAFIRKKAGRIVSDEDQIICETLVAFFQRIRNHEQKKSNFILARDKKLSNYIFTILRNKLNDYYKAQKKYELVEDHKSHNADGAQERTSQLNRIPDSKVETIPGFLSDKLYYQICLRQALQRTRKRVHKDSTIIFERYELKGEAPAAVAAALNKNVQAVYEAKRKFLEILNSEFAHILNAEGTNSSTTKSRAILANLLGEFTEDNAVFDVTETLGLEDPFISRVEFIRQQLSKHQLPEQSGDYIFLLDKSDGEGINGQWRRLTHPRTAVGKLEQSTISLKTEGVSGIHAAFTNKNDQWMIMDEGSKNSTYCNGNKLKQKSPIRLTSGDLIQIVNHLIIFIKVDPS